MSRNQRFDIYCETCGYAFKRAYPANPDTLRPYDCPRWQAADRNAQTTPAKLDNRRHRTTCVDPFDPRIRPAVSGHVRDLRPEVIEAAVTYRVKVTIGSEETAGNGLTFDSLDAADAYAIDLLGRWFTPNGYIVESSGVLSNESGEWKLCAVRTRDGAESVRRRFIAALVKASQ
jgi:hypothetical protein